MIRYYPLTGVPKVNVGGYGPRTSGGVTKLHDAVDLGAPTGTPVIAMADGTITYGTDVLGGNVAVLRLAASPDAYYMAHLLRVQSGSRKVIAGEQIAECDTTGNAALVGIPHVHTQWWSNGTFAGPHPDPTADLNAAQLLAAPIGGSRYPYADIALVTAGVLAAAGLGYLAWREIRSPGELLPWRAYA